MKYRIGMYADLNSLAKALEDPPLPDKATKGFLEVIFDGLLPLRGNAQKASKVRLTFADAALKKMREALAQATPSNDGLPRNALDAAEAASN